MKASSLTWRRAHRTFWLLVAVAVVAAGSLSSAAHAQAGPLTAVRVAISGTALILSLALAGRVFVHLERARRAGHPATGKTTTPTKAPNRRSV